MAKPFLNWRAGTLYENIPAFFLALGLLLGTLYGLILPPLQAPDEIAHFDRTLILASGHCIADPDILIPQQFANLQSLYPGGLERTRQITVAELAALARLEFKENPKVQLGYNYGSLDSCVPYMPAAAVMSIARLFHTPLIDLMYLGRLGNLAAYLAIVYLALLLIPDLRLLLFGLALMPMTLHQAASLSRDSLTLATAFLLSAYILKLAFGSEQSITWRDQLALAAIVAVIALCKFNVTNVWVLFLMILIPASKFGGNRRRWIAIGLQVGLACCCAVAWLVLNHSNIAQFTTTKADLGVQIGANLRYVYEEPLLFTAALLRTVTTDGYELLMQFVGKMGWLTVPLPAWDVVAYVALLALIALTQTRQIHLSSRQRVTIALMVTAGAVGAFIVLWSIETPRTYVDAVISRGKGVLPGMQGRYFIPLALPFFLLFTNRGFHINERAATVLAVGLVLLSSAVALNRMRVAFYASTSREPGDVAYARATLLHEPVTQAHYEGNLVRRPGPTTEDSKIYVIRDGVKHWVLDSLWITSHGYRWPGDVVMISREDLDAIPAGDPFSSSSEPAAAPSRYEGQLVRRPGPTPEDGRVYLIRNGVKHWVMDKRWIVQNGFRWPDDVKTIPGNDLDPIPIGEPLNYKP